MEDSLMPWMELIDGAAGSQYLHPKRSLSDLWFKCNFSGAIHRETGMGRA